MLPRNMSVTEYLPVSSAKLAATASPVPFMKARGVAEVTISAVEPIRGALLAAGSIQVVMTPA